MNRDIARDLFAKLNMPTQLMEEALDELDFMARYKYDNYEMYTPAGRFLEHLYRWLTQFSTVVERQTALKLVREHLIFISQREMQDLARFLYFEQIVPIILDRIILDKHLPAFAYGQAFAHFAHYLRRILFIGLSDGAKIDFFRRHNIQVSQEQVLPYYRSTTDDYLSALQEEGGLQDDKFWAVFLIDDFTGSGYTLLREEIDNDTDSVRLGGSVERAYKQHQALMDAASSIYICEYVATESSLNNVQALADRTPHYKGKLKLLCPLMLPAANGLTPERAIESSFVEEIVALCERYHNEDFDTPNTRKGGGIKFGYGGYGLTLVLYSNTPNNSLFLLWFETIPERVPSFTALFPRIDRHKPQ